MSLTLALLTALSAQAAPASAAPPAAEEKKICRTKQTTGTRMGGTRVCRTRAEWTALSRDTNMTRLLDSLDTRGNSRGSESEASRGGPR